MDIHEYLDVARRRWVSILICALLGGLLALAFSAAQTKVYAASSQLFVTVGSAVDGTSVNSSSTFALQRIKSYVSIVDAEPVLQGAIDDAGLGLTPEQLAGRVSASNPPQTVLLNTTVTDTDPAQAALVANAVAVRYADHIETLETPEAGSAPVKVTQIMPAAVPGSPVSPRTTVNVALGLLLGLGAGIAWALLRDRLDTSVKSPSQLSDLAGVPTLGVLLHHDDPALPLVALDQTSQRGEAVRALRTNLSYVDIDNPPQLVVITSGVQGEGKTTIGGNLGIALAQAGKSVCLVEADLRRPMLSTLLGIDSALGLTDVLASNESLEQVLVPWRRQLFDVLPSGRKPPNPSELLASSAMQAILDTLRQRYDVVVVDAAPLLPVADGAITASLADAALLVARSGFSNADTVTKAAEALRRVDARLVGAVLNDVSVEEAASDGYGYGYGYGYAPVPEPAGRKRGHGAADGDEVPFQDLLR